MENKQQPQAIGWTVQGWSHFWKAPSIEVARKRVPLVCAPDIVGYWPRQPVPVHGRDDYCQYILDLLTMVPDLRLKLEEHATSGEFTFVRWTGRGTGPDGPFAANGIDRIRVRDGKVIENRVVSDAAIFEDLARFVAERRRTSAA
jgi:hypothetical protein